MDSAGETKLWHGDSDPLSKEQSFPEDGSRGRCSSCKTLEHFSFFGPVPDLFLQTNRRGNPASCLYPLFAALSLLHRSRALPLNLQRRMEDSPIWELCLGLLVDWGHHDAHPRSKRLYPQSFGRRIAAKQKRCVSAQERQPSETSSRHSELISAHCCLETTWVSFGKRRRGTFPERRSALADELE
jgi:hypothetical protein